MTSQEIKPRQLRALLLLLFLVPLIPAALMVRFMFDTLKAERLSALERIQQFHTESLTMLARRVRPPNASPEKWAQAIYDQWSRTGAEVGVRARVVDSAGNVLAGEESVWDRPVATAQLPGMPALTMQVFLTGPEVLDQTIAEQRQFLIRTGVFTTFGVIMIAGLAALALNRQLALNELKSTSVATVAHELRTPLASMRMLVDTLREGRVRGEAQKQEYLALIASENERLTRLAEDFLTFSRLDRGTQHVRTEAVAPREAAEIAVNSLRGRLEGVAFELDVPKDLPAVCADRDALGRVLGNLLDNALKYSGDAKQISLRAHVDGSTVAFAVKDNGIGLTADERDAIFQPFYQVDQKLSRTREGCGLGLAIVQGIVEAHGGKISIASTPGKGSVFTVKIPLA